MHGFAVKKHYAHLADSPSDRLLVTLAVLKADNVEFDVLDPIDAQEQVH